MLLLTCLALAGCETTVTRKQVGSNRPSFDGNSADSGAKGFVQTERGKELEISPATRERYNALVREFGGRQVVPVEPDAGLTKLPNGNWSMNKEAQFNFAWFSYLKRQPETKNPP